MNQQVIESSIQTAVTNIVYTNVYLALKSDYLAFRRNDKLKTSKSQKNDKILLHIETSDHKIGAH